MYYNDPFYGDPFSDIMSFFMIFFAIYGAILLVFLANYVIHSIGILRMSGKLGRKNGWLGFVPIARQYQLGSLAGDISIGKKQIKNPGLWMALLPIMLNIVVFAIYMAVVFGSIISLGSSTAYHDEAGMIRWMGGFLVGLVFFYLAIYAGSVVLIVFRLLVLHRVFSFFHDGQRPVFHVILSAFVPLAEGILLIRNAGKPIITLPPYYQPPYYPPEGPYPPYGQGPSNPPYSPYDPAAAQSPYLPQSGQPGYTQQPYDIPERRPPDQFSSNSNPNNDQFPQE